MSEYEFEYFYKTGEYHRWNGAEDEWDGDDGYEFTYYVDKKDIIETLAKIIVLETSVFDGVYMSEADKTRVLEKFLSEYGDIDQLVSDYYDELKEAFYDDAMEYEADNQ